MLALADTFHQQYSLQPELLSRSRAVKCKIGEMQELEPSSDLPYADRNFRYASRVMYDGTSFCGWQDVLDPKVRTVQGTLARAFSQRFNCNVRIVGASRTDKGVHARGQTIHFDIGQEIDPPYAEYTLNRLLPNDVRIYDTALVWKHSEATNSRDPSALFHATGSAKKKLYIYRFYSGKTMDPMKRKYCAHFYQVRNVLRKSTTKKKIAYP